MELKVLKNIEDEEKEKAKDDAKKALRYWRDWCEKDIKKLLNLIYGVNEANMPTSFVNTGNVKEIALFSRPIVTIFPFFEEKELQQCYKATSKEIAELTNEGIIFPIIQPASRYNGLDYLYPIIQTRPKDYFTRSVYFYSIFFDENIELVKVGRLQLSQTLARMFEKGEQHRGLKKALLDKYEDVRELYDRGRFLSPAEKLKRIKENIIYRYASVASFIGEDATDFILDSLKPRESLKVLLHLHIVFDHYFTQGLLSHLHDHERSYLRDAYGETLEIRDWLTNAFDLYTVILGDSIPINVISSPTVNEIMKAHEEGLLSCYPLIESKKIAYQQIENLRADLLINIEDAKEKIEKIDFKKKRVEKFVTISAFALSGVLSKFDITAGIASLIGGLILPPAIIDMISEGIKKRIREREVRETIGYVHTLWTPFALRKKDD